MRRRNGITLRCRVLLETARLMIGHRMSATSRGCRRPTRIMILLVMAHFVPVITVTVVARDDVNRHPGHDPDVQADHIGGTGMIGRIVRLIGGQRHPSLRPFTG